MMVADCRGINYDGNFFVEILKQGTLTVNYAPMLAVLFLAARMRVNWLTQGKGEPPASDQIAMICFTHAILAMTLAALVIPIFTGETYKVNEQTGDLHGDHVHEHNINHDFFQC